MGKVNQDHEVISVGALYHPPKPLYGAIDLLEYIEASVAYLLQNFADAHFILAGDLNQMSDNEVVIRTGMSSLVTQPTRRNSNLDRLYVSDFDYPGVTVVQSVVTSDHKAIVAYNGANRFKVSQTCRVCSCRRHTASQNARFSASMPGPIHIANSHGDPEVEFGKLYADLLKSLNTLYPVRKVSVTSADPPYVTPSVKHMLRRKKLVSKYIL